MHSRRIKQISTSPQNPASDATTTNSPTNSTTHSSTKSIPVLITGDFNSFPHDEIYSFVTSPDDQIHAVELYQNKFHLSFAMKKSINELYGPNTKFLCDLSLSRLCRWLRMLGVDAAMDSWDQPATSTGINEVLTKEHDLGMSFASTREDMIQAHLSQLDHSTAENNTTANGANKNIPEEHMIVADAFHMIPLNRLSSTTTVTTATTNSTTNTMNGTTETKEKFISRESPENSTKGAIDTTLETEISVSTHPKVAHHAHSSSIVRNDAISASVRSMTTPSTHPGNTNANNPNKLKKQDRMNNINAFFQRARDEKRVILTSSRSLIQRNTCPQSYCVNPSILEKELVNVYREFGLDLKKERFLTVCGKCGGEIIEADLSDPRLMGKIIPTDRVVFICKTCGQVRFFLFFFYELFFIEIFS